MYEDLPILKKFRDEQLKKIDAHLKEQEKEIRWNMIKAVFLFCTFIYSMHLDPEFWRYIFSQF